MNKLSALLISLCLSGLCSQAAGAAGPDIIMDPGIRVKWNSKDISPRVRKRVEALLAQTRTNTPVEIEVGITVPSGKSDPEGYYLRVVDEAGFKRIKVGGEGRGLHYGLYAALQKLGYRFWHPLRPFVPKSVTLPAEGQELQTPAYHARGFTHHTMHPLEMTHLLNGWGPGGPEDEAGWKKLLPEWESYLEWLIANRQNEMEWILLEKAPWGEFSRSQRRQERLKQLFAIGHDWKLRIGIDAPLTLEQQNGWRLIPKPGDKAFEKQQLQSNLDWLAATGADFVSTEMGTSEFTHGGAQGMLDALNAATDHLAAKGLPFFTKIHISSGQFTEELKDPQTGGPLNYNFLPYYADPRLGVMPHTVQIYALDDPAPTYGRQNFNDMLRFMRFTSGKRPMLWYPETAYWVNYDIHVPLFLPVYARQRLHDMRLLQKEGIALDGQMIFSSGWENGYWLNDVIAALSVWQPGDESQSDRAVLQAQLSELFAPYGQAKDELVALLLDTMELQHRLLVLGQTRDGKRPADIVRRNGIAYLAGQDTWSQTAATIRAFGLKGYQTQPERLEFQTLMQEPESLDLYYEVAPLLAEMKYDFANLATRADALAKRVPPEMADWFAELRNGLQFNALRARQVDGLMAAAAAKVTGQEQIFRTRLREGFALLGQAEALAQEQTRTYKADPARIAAWIGANPTVYNYGYLWPGRSLYFWKRDWLQVASGNFNPCLLNIIDPLEVALPDPAKDGRAGAARALGPLLGLADCLKVGKPDLSLENLARHLPD